MIAREVHISRTCLTNTPSKLSHMTAKGGRGWATFLSRQEPGTRCARSNAENEFEAGRLHTSCSLCHVQGEVGNNPLVLTWEGFKVTF